MLKLSLVSSLTGILLLYVGATQMKGEITPISQIDKDFVGLKTRISGKVIDIREHSKGHLFLKVKDSSGGVISVPIFTGVRNNLDRKIELLDNIEISGRVEEYEGELELLPGGAESIRHFHSSPVGIGNIDKSKIGSTVKVRGNIAGKEIVGGGSLVLQLCQGNNNIPVFIPNYTSGGGGFPSLQVGNTVKLAGNVQLYEGELELKVDNPYNVEIIGARE